MGGVIIQVGCGLVCKRHGEVWRKMFPPLGQTEPGVLADEVNYAWAEHCREIESEIDFEI